MAPANEWYTICEQEFTRIEEILKKDHVKVTTLQDTIRKFHEDIITLYEVLTKQKRNDSPMTAAI